MRSSLMLPTDGKNYAKLPYGVYSRIYSSVEKDFVSEDNEILADGIFEILKYVKSGIGKFFPAPPLMGNYPCFRFLRGID